MPLTGKQMVTLLVKHGWIIVGTTGSHRRLKKQGVPHIIVVPIHGNKDLKKGLEQAILKMAGLTPARKEHSL